MSAVFSPCRTWRYTLTRRTEIGYHFITYGQPPGSRERTVAFIGLNPSTADETVNDPTIRRCIGYAQRWGYHRLVMLNIFALRSTDPKLLYGVDTPKRVGLLNDDYIRQEAGKADLVVCAWGTHGKLDWRGPDVARMLRADNVRLHTLGLTKEGYPKHPLYLRGDLEPVAWPGQ